MPLDNVFILSRDVSFDDVSFVDVLLDLAAMVFIALDVLRDVVVSIDDASLADVSLDVVFLEDVPREPASDSSSSLLPFNPDESVFIAPDDMVLNGADVSLDIAEVSLDDVQRELCSLAFMLGTEPRLVITGMSRHMCFLSAFKRAISALSTFTQRIRSLEVSAWHTYVCAFFSFDWRPP